MVVGPGSSVPVARAVLGSWTRLQLAAFVMASFCILKVATVITGHGVTALGLGE